MATLSGFLVVAFVLIYALPRVGRMVSMESGRSGMHESAFQPTGPSAWTGEGTHFSPATSLGAKKSLGGTNKDGGAKRAELTIYESPSGNPEASLLLDETTVMSLIDKHLAQMLSSGALKGEKGDPGPPGPPGTPGSDGGTYFVGAPGTTAKDGAGSVGSFRYLGASEASVDKTLIIGTASNTVITGDSVTTDSVTTNSITIGGTISQSGGSFTGATTTIIGNLTVQDSNGAAQLFVDNNSARVGIGTTGPETTLHTIGTVRKVGTFSLGTRLGEIRVVGKYAYVLETNAPGTGAIYVLDISTPASPTLIGTSQTGSLGVAFNISGRYAYNLLWSSRLDVFDVSSPSSISLVKSTNNFGSSQVTSIAVAGRYAYITGGLLSSSGTLKTYDISNPTVAPVQVGSVSTGGGPRVVVKGRYAYLKNDFSNTFQVIDVSNPASPTAVGSLDTDTAGESDLDMAHTIQVQGEYAYVTNKTSNTMQVIKVSDPTTPTSVGTVAFSGSPFNIFVSGRYAYVVADDRKLNIIDISDPTSPEIIQTADTSSASGAKPTGVYATGRYVYVTNWEGATVEIFDIGGVEANALLAHSVNAGTLQVWDEAIVEGKFSVRDSLSIGAGGFYSTGEAGITASSSKSALNVTQLSTGPAAVITGGNVGIGTTTPAQILTIQGGVCVDDTSGVSCGSRTVAAGNIEAEGTITANAFDVAEIYGSDGSLEPGDIVSGVALPVAVIPGRADSRPEVSKSTSADNPFLGIVSEEPAFLLGWSATSTDVAIALAGRVPVKISLENGPIKAGDPITLSSTPGVGAKATTATKVIGYALDDYPATATSGKALVAIQPGFWQGPMDEETGALAFVVDVLAKLGATLKKGVLSVIEVIADKITARQVKTQELCLDDVCVTRDQFLQMLEGAATAPVAQPPPPELLPASSADEPASSLDKDEEQETPEEEGTGEAADESEKPVAPVETYTETATSTPH